MAPVISKRPSATSPTRKSSSSLPNTIPRERKRDGLFSTTKKDKRIIKHSALISRIEKSKAPSKKRRRPSKKLITTLESLADALPETTNDTDGAIVVGNAKIRHTSLKSRPGAMKKKEALINLEKERFNKNMAQMAALPTVGDAAVNNGEVVDTGCSSGNRWAALRQFIQNTTERRSDTITEAT